MSGMRMCLEKLYEFRKALALLTLVAMLIFGIIFSLTTFNVVGRCLTDPCIAETGSLLRIHSGLSFAVLLTGFLFILQPIYGLWFFKVKCTDIVGGAFVGATLLLGLLGLMTCAIWSSITDGVATMDPIVNRSATFTGNANYLASFRAVAGLSGVYTCLALMNAFQLSFCLEFFCDNDAAKLRAQRFADRIRRGYQYQGVSGHERVDSPDDDLDDDI